MCLFCKIIGKQIPANIVFEDEHVLAFHDINPVAPAHALVIPKKHIASISEATADDEATLGKVLLAAKRVAETLKLVDTGYRVVLNTGPNANQTVFHIHAHVIGGRPMTWPPG